MLDFFLQCCDGKDDMTTISMNTLKPTEMR